MRIFLSCRQRSSFFGVAIMVASFAATLCAQLSNSSQTAPEIPPTSQLPALPQLRPSTPHPPAVLITIEQAIEFAKRNNPTLQANRTLISQNKEQEVTANLRPNPALTLDTQFLPIFNPDNFNSNYLENNAEFDLGIGYLFERGKKRQHRLKAAQDQTAVTESQVLDAERSTVENAAQQFVNALLAGSNLQFAEQLLQSYEKTVEVSQERYKAGGLSKVDLLKIQLQTLQFQSDVSAARIARVQALASLRQLLGFGSVPRDFDVAGELACKPLGSRVEDLEARAVQLRPDLQAAQRGVEAAKSQIGLAKANAKQDVSFSFDYSHVNASNNGSFFFTIPLPIFNRNQGEVARTYFALTQSQFQRTAAEELVLTDVSNAYEALINSQDVLQLYDKGFLQQSQESLDITAFSYKQGAASLLDFLDAERSYRATQLSYRQAVATCMNAQEQLRQAVGTRELQ